MPTIVKSDSFKWNQLKSGWCSDKLSVLQSFANCGTPGGDTRQAGTDPSGEQATERIMAAGGRG